MKPTLRILNRLLEQDLAEASVHRPPRGRIWMAVYTGPVPGEQEWHSTGLTDRAAALALAKKWEAAARAQRQAAGKPWRKPTVRVRRKGSGQAGGLTQAQVAALLHISVRGEREIERRALRRLFNDPRARELWRAYLAGELEEDQRRLTAGEIAVRFALGRPPGERVPWREVLRFLSG